MIIILIATILYKKEEVASTPSDNNYQGFWTEHRADGTWRMAGAPSSSLLAPGRPNTVHGGTVLSVSCFVLECNHEAPRVSATRLHAGVPPLACC